MLIFDEEVREKYAERCSAIENGFSSMAASKAYFSGDINIYIEDAAENEWDENVRVLAGDGDDTGSWKIIVPFNEYLGSIFKMHIVTGFTLIAYDMKYGKGSFNKIRNLDKYKKIFGIIGKYFDGLAGLNGGPIPVEVRNG